MQHDLKPGAWLTIIGIVFIILKATGYIDWSWWWVTSPFWVPLVMILVGATIVYLLRRGE